MPIPLPMIPKIGPLERLFSRPSWADPTFMMLANEANFTEITIAPGATVILCTPDPKRWGLIVTKPNPSTAPVIIYPDGTTPALGIELLTTDNLKRFNIHSYGPLVCYQWWATSVSAVTLGVWEISIGV